MEIKFYQVDAFTNRLFSGNPAGVCFPKKWLDDCILQDIGTENNLPETAFVVPVDNDQFEIRWFTPTVEVDLYGHATLAAAFTLFDQEGYANDTINFISPRSGKLSVTKNNSLLSLNFPVDSFSPVAITDEMLAAFKARPIEAYRGKSDLLLIFDKQEVIAAIDPDLKEVSKFGGRGVIISAPGEEVDFVSRFFAPQSGIPEDPVTGSAHTTLTPYWSQRIGKKQLTARQLSLRGGYLECEDQGERILISGECVLYKKGCIML